MEWVWVRTMEGLDWIGHGHGSVLWVLGFRVHWALGSWFSDFRIFGEIWTYAVVLVALDTDRTLDLYYIVVSRGPGN